MGEMAAEINQVVPAMCKKATAANALNEKRFMGLTRTSSATAGESEHGKFSELFHKIKLGFHTGQRLAGATG